MACQGGACPASIDALLAEAWVSPPRTHARTQRLMTRAHTLTRTHELARTNAHGLAACSGGCCTASRGSMAMCGSSGFHPTSGCSLPRRTARRFALSTLDACTAVLTSTSVVKIAGLRKVSHGSVWHKREDVRKMVVRARAAAAQRSTPRAGRRMGHARWLAGDVDQIGPSGEYSRLPKVPIESAAALSARRASAAEGCALCMVSQRRHVPSVSSATPIVCAGTCTAWRGWRRGDECSGR